jgi:hypothetical protein
MPDIKAHNLESTARCRAVRDLDARPLLTFVLMTSFSEFP